MSEERALYVHCKRQVRNHTLRQVVMAGNILAHQMQAFVNECVSLGAPDAAEEEAKALAIWEAALAQLRGEVSEVQS